MPSSAPLSAVDAAAIAAAVGPAPLPLVYLGHDLRAALAEMRYGLNLIQALDLPSAAQATLGQCVAAGEMLTRLLDQSVLVCLGQGEPGVTEPVAVDIAEWLSALRLRFQGLARQSGHQLDLREASVLPQRLVIDRTSIDRILTNIVVNALCHTAPCAVNVSVGTTETATGLWFNVSDRGPGFRADQLTQLASDLPVQSADLHPDHGFGLQSVRYLVDALGGEFYFTNRPEGGAEVGFSLPVTEDKERPALHEIAPLARPLAGMRALLVDDSAACRSATAAILRQLGLTPVETSDGAGALAALTSGERFDLLVLDDQMPDVTGLDVLNRLAVSLPADRRPPVLVLTSFAPPDRLQALTQAGTHHVLLKPVLDPAVMADAVQTALSRVSSPAAEPPLVAQATPAPEPDEQLGALQRLAEMAGSDAAAELFQRLKEDLDGAQHGLAHAVETRDIQAIRRQSHILIALAGTSGAMALHHDAIELNRLSHSDAASERTFALAQRVDRAIAKLTASVQRLSNAAAPPAPKDHGVAP